MKNTLAAAVVALSLLLAPLTATASTPVRLAAQVVPSASVTAPTKQGRAKAYKVTAKKQVTPRKTAKATGKKLRSFVAGTTFTTTGLRKRAFLKVTKGSVTGWVRATHLRRATKAEAAGLLTPAQIKKKYTNGRLPSSALVKVSYDHDQRMTPLAYQRWKLLNKVFKVRFGTNIPIDLSYRSYTEQVAMRRQFGTGAAVPGTSNHGWGMAIDLPDYRFSKAGKLYNFGTVRYEWLKKNAPKYGWCNPPWAQRSGYNPEPWHFQLCELEG